MISLSRRYVEVSGLQSPPTLDMITAINVRSAVEQIGTLSFSDPMMNNVQVNGREMVVGDGQGGRWWWGMFTKHQPHRPWFASTTFCGAKQRTS